MREPQGVLGEIVARKRADVAARLAGLTIEELRARAQPTTRSLRAALSARGARFVMEVKRASPSQGALRDDLEPAVVARAYRGVADAVSVLTDGPYFGGSFDDLRAVRAELGCPVLCKDFLVDPRQVAEARGHGADAVLVMLSVLDDAEARSCIDEAARLGMDALVEAHTAEEVDRAVALGARVIGINNRDLKTLTVDLATTERLAARVPSDRVLVTESGIGDEEDVGRLAPRVDAFLVGSALMRCPSPGWMARSLVWGRVKVCGLTSAAAVDAARAAGATYGGVIFVADSPRWVDRAVVDEIENAARDDWPLSLVGVFRDAEIASIVGLAERHDLEAVQLHGRYDDDALVQLRDELPSGCEIWGVAGVEDALEEAPSVFNRTVFDSSVDGRSGGTGRTFDWSLLTDRVDLDRAVLAGGLNPGNARSAKAVGAWALDVNSGVEDAPGIKSPEKLAALFEALRPPSRKESA